MIFQGRGAPKIDVFSAPVREPPSTPPREPFFRIRAVLGPFYGRSLGGGGGKIDVFSPLGAHWGPEWPKDGPVGPRGAPETPKIRYVDDCWSLLDAF